MLFNGKNARISFIVPDVGVIGAAKSSVGVIVETRFLGWPNARGCRRVNF